MTPRSKLRRLARSDDAGEASPDWASLDRDLVELIGWRVLAGDLQDYVQFRAVCSHWSASTAAPRGRGVLDPRFHPRRWMMLPEGHGLYPPATPTSAASCASSTSPPAPSPAPTSRS